MNKSKVKIDDAIISLMIYNRLKNKGGISVEKDIMLSVLFFGYSSNLVEKFMYESYLSNRKN